MIYDEGRAKHNGFELPIQCILLNMTREHSNFTPPHYHDYIEILYILKGSFIMITDEEYICNEGDMALVNSGEAHTLLPNGTDCTYIVVKFLPQILHAREQTLFEAKYMLPFTLSTPSYPRIIRRDELSDSEIPSVIKNMMREWQEQSYGYELAVRAGLITLLLWILRYRHFTSPETEEISFSNSQLTKVLRPAFEYATKNLATANAMEASEICGLSYSYFSRSFREATSKSFTEYLTRLRLSEAEGLLISGNMNMTEIAQKCGFSTSSYFIAQFKKYKKLTPCQFRKKFRATQSPDNHFEI